jgi:transcriptional regulator with XRE-family HTH domain
MLGLKYIGQIKGLDLKDVSALIDVTPQSMNSWVHGKRKFPQERIKQMAEVLNVPEEYITKQITDKDKIEILKLEIERLR